MTVEASRAVVCGECGGAFSLHPRNVRAAQARGEEPVCHECRHKPKVDPAAVERMKRWWLKRYSLEELRETFAGFASLEAPAVSDLMRRHV